MSRTPETVADLMRAWRAAAGINTAQAGTRVGLSKRTIEDIEQGRVRADDELTRIALKFLIKSAKIGVDYIRESPYINTHRPAPRGSSGAETETMSTITQGSAKQIEWASSIAADLMPRLNAVRAKAEALQNPVLRDACITGIDQIINNSNASFWIDQTETINGGRQIDTLIVDAVSNAIIAHPDRPATITEASARTNVAKFVRSVQ